MKLWGWVMIAVVALVGALVWWGVLDGAPPRHAEGVFDLEGYRALVADDAPDTRPTEVRVEFVGESQAPGFAAEAGAFGPQRTFTYASFQIVAPDGGLIIDGAVDADTLTEMADGAGRFDEQSYYRVLAAMETTPHIMITHEHLDHVMALASHPRPEAIAPHLALTDAQLAALPQHAPGGVLAPAIANAPTRDLTAPQRIAPGIVAVAMPGHSAGTIVIYVKSRQREYLFIGDIAWMMSSIENLRGRPRLIGLLVPGVDPDRPAVLRQIRALHDLARENPEIVILAAHDKADLDARIADGILEEGFASIGRELGDNPPPDAPNP